MCPVRHRLNSLLHADAHLHLFIPLSSRYGIHPAIGLSLLGYAYLCAMCGSLQMQDPSENLAGAPSLDHLSILCMCCYKATETSPRIPSHWISVMGGSQANLTGVQCSTARKCGSRRLEYRPASVAGDLAGSCSQLLCSPVPGGVFCC